MSRDIYISYIELSLSSRRGEINVYNLTFAKTLEVAGFSQTLLISRKISQRQGPCVHPRTLSSVCPWSGRKQCLTLQILGR